MRWKFQSVRLAKIWRTDNTHCWKKCEDFFMFPCCFPMSLNAWFGNACFSERIEATRHTFSVLSQCQQNYLCKWSVLLLSFLLPKGKKSTPATPVDLCTALWIPFLSTLRVLLQFLAILSVLGYPYSLPLYWDMSRHVKMYHRFAHLKNPSFVIICPSISSPISLVLLTINLEQLIFYLSISTSLHIIHQFLLVLSEVF